MMMSPSPLLLTLHSRIPIPIFGQWITPFADHTLIAPRVKQDMQDRCCATVVELGGIQG
jgi:hypothetical protein